MPDELMKVAEDSARGGFFLVSGTALATVIMAVASILVGRLLGPDLYGQYTLALVVPQLLVLFTDLGINQGVTKFVAEINAKGGNGQIGSIIRQALLLRLIVGTILSVVSYIFAESLAIVFLQRPDLAFLVQVGSASLLFQVLFTTATSAFVGIDKSEYSAIATNVQAIAKTTISVGLVVAGLGVAGAVWGYTASFVIGGAAGGLILAVLMRWKRKGGDKQSEKGDLAAVLRYGAPLYVALLLVGFMPLFQNMMLAYFSTDAAVGNYKAAVNFATLLTILSIPITTALLPAFAKLDPSNHERIKVFFKVANKYTAVLVLPVTVLIMTYSTEIVGIIYGVTYNSAPLFLAMYCILYFLVGLGYLTLASFYNGMGETRTSMYISVLTFGTLAVLSPILTRAYDVPGLIIAFIVASALGTAYGSYRARRKYRIEFDTVSVLKVYGISILAAVPSVLLLFTGALSNAVQMVAPAFLLSRIHILPQIVDLAVGGFLYILLYATLAPLTRTITLPELEMAERVIRKTKLLTWFAAPFLRYERKILNSMQK